MAKDVDRFFNRELSWIEFNARVLFEAQRKEVPLAEQLRFLGIVSSNFDEFFMVRVARLLRTEHDMPDLSELGRDEVLERISLRAHELIEEQSSHLMTVILPELSKKGIEYLSADRLDQFLNMTRRIFLEEVWPVLTPLRADKTLPRLTNRCLYAAFILKSIPDKTGDGEEERFFSIVQIPPVLSRIVRLPSENHTLCFTLLDDIILEHGTLLFPGYQVEESLLFRVTCDEAFGMDDDTDHYIIHSESSSHIEHFIHEMENIIEQRKAAAPIRFICNKRSEILKKELMNKIGLGDRDVYVIDGILDMQGFSGIADLKELSDLCYPRWDRFYPRSLKKEEPLWDDIKHSDILLHVPYESYDPVIQLLNDASEDEAVLSIKMTLYRTSTNSPIIRALEKAAEKGKQVTVLVELQARFDEERNISWAERLERAGAIVIYGVVNFKVHAKILLIVRRELEGICRYTHISTGNYNDKTAGLYVDMSLFTANTEIANDANLFFNFISGYSKIQHMSHLVMAPTGLKQRLIEMIEREISLHTSDSPGLIMAKINGLSHPEIISALYRASRKGVRILLNVRGICLLIPGVSGMSENIRVVSIIDRYLEHTRMFYFYNGGDDEIYLSSADWMPRNLERRVELMFPVMNKEHIGLCREILSLYFSDDCKSFVLQNDGTWKPNTPADMDNPMRVQEKLYTIYRDLFEQGQVPPQSFVVRRRN